MDNKTIYYTAPPPKPATLLILENNKNVRVITLDSDMKMGRDNTEFKNDIVLESSIVSRKHGSFFFSEDAYYYRDDNSLNGTFYNGTKMQKMNERGSKAVKLQDGDMLRIDRRDLNKPHPQAVVIIFSTSFSKTENWHRFPLDKKTEIPIGRNQTDGISLSDFMVSRHHAILKKQGKNWKIIDNKSKNGIAVNKKMIDGSKTLHPFDVLRIANTNLIFLEDEIIYHDSKPDIHFDYQNRSVMMSVNIDTVLASRPDSPLKKKMLLKDIHLDIETGDFILVLGGAGAGKSTFIKVITGHNHDAEQILDIKGKILLEGMDLYKNLRMLKEKIGIVPQYPDYRFNDTVYHTIMDSARIQLAGEHTLHEIKQRVDEVIENMMLTSIKDSMLSVISGGQRKRVQVAIKAVGDISFFTYDEPDAGLDIAGRIDQMKQLVSPIIKEESDKRAEDKDNVMELYPCTETGCAGLMISHYPDDVAYMYKKVIVLAKSQKDDAGHLAFYGDVQNALSFFNVNKLSEIIMKINYEGGQGLGDEYIRKFEHTRRG